MTATRRSSACRISCLVLPFTANRNGNPNLSRYASFKRLQPLEFRWRQLIETRAGLLRGRRVAHSRPRAQDRDAPARAPVARPAAARSTCSIMARCSASTFANGRAVQGPLGHPRRMFEDPADGGDEMLRDPENSGRRSSCSLSAGRAIDDGSLHANFAHALRAGQREQRRKYSLRAVRLFENRGERAALRRPQINEVRGLSQG